jgi:tetratricopeptide (TPR) repeat protein
MSSLRERRAARQIEEALQRDNWEKARLLIRQWLRREPKNHWLLTRLGLTYYEQKQYKRALHYELKALQIEPYCPLVVWDYAGTLDMLGRKKEALSVYRWLTSWGEERLAYGPCGEGIRAARSLIADCFYRIGAILEEQGQRKRAVAAFREHLSRRTRGTRSIYPLSKVRRRYAKLSSRWLA